MKYLKYFQTEAERSTYKSSSDFILPNVNYVVESDSVEFNPYVAPVLQKAGDIVYYVNGGLKTIGYADWSSELGTPVGVITIPEGFAPDGKSRMVALSGQTNKTWGEYSDISELNNYNKVPTTDNAGNTSTSSHVSGFLPSDKFTGNTSYVDSVAKYSQSSNMIPSPYITMNGKNEPNPEYYKTILSGETNVNVLADFDGLNNTQILVSLGTDCPAANACWTYKDAANSDIQWYLPACGELGYMMPRFNEIQAGLAAVSAVQLRPSISYWSSSEDSNFAYYVSTYNGSVFNETKITNYYVRPWAVVE